MSSRQRTSARWERLRRLRSIDAFKTARESANGVGGGRKEKKSWAAKTNTGFGKFSAPGKEAGLPFLEALALLSDSKSPTLWGPLLLHCELKCWILARARPRRAKKKLCRSWRRVNSSSVARMQPTFLENAPQINKCEKRRRRERSAAQLWRRAGWRAPVK